jgi:hypothetical protein
MRERDLPPRGTRRHPRAAVPFAGEHARHDRARIAQTAARLIVEHGIDDWALAKRKAARQLLLPDGAGHPSNEEIEAALIEHQALFGGDAQRNSLRAQRQCALAWMRRLAAWSPLLVGAVAAGWASPHSDVRIELAADDAKAIEILLAGHEVDYRSEGGQAAGTATRLLIGDGEFAVRLEVVTPNDRRHRARQDAAVRLDAAALTALLDVPAPNV